ncbi:MAG: argininosuccinate lyase [Candidatus Bathyarchaeia archaeon]
MRYETVFQDELESEALEFTSREDLKLDLKYLFVYDIYLHAAHNIMQCSEGYLETEELLTILGGLKDLLKEYPKVVSEDYLKRGIEDVHSLIEFLLTGKIGDAGLNARFNLSRNDEIATLERMSLRDETIKIAEMLLELCSALLTRAEGDGNIVMPAFTHLQVAQPTTAGYYWLCNVDEILRDLHDLKILFTELNESPLGACAISGAPKIDGIGIDRGLTAKLLGFDGIIENTIDAVSSRGEIALRFLYVMNTLLTLHLSRLSEDIVVWSSMGLVKIPKGYATSSSLLPQKTNPDIAELLRAKAGRIVGNLVKVATICKALPTGYSRDLQEIKPVLFESIETIKAAIGLMSRFIMALELNEGKMSKLLKDNWAAATDLANAVAIKYHVPYRKAYLIVKRMAQGEDLERASRAVVGFKIQFSHEEIDDLLDPKRSVERRSNKGGPSPSGVVVHAEKARKEIRELSAWFKCRAQRVRDSFSNLEDLMSKILENRTFSKDFVKFKKIGR